MHGDTAGGAKRHGPPLRTAPPQHIFVIDARHRQIAAIDGLFAAAFAALGARLALADR